jgi:hypothetical protein
MIVNGVDYTKIASIAEQSGISYDALCKRAERGERLLVETSHDWVDYRGAADILCVQYHSLAGQLSQKCELEYFGIEWKSRSMNKAIQGKRGCGVLFKRSDLERVAEIRVGAHLGLFAALKVFQAMKQGRI